MATFIHDPDAKLDYGFNWAGTPTWLGTDTIVTSTWTVTPRTAGDVSMVLSSSTHDTTTTTIWADGGTNGNDYVITNHIVTVAGREETGRAALYIERLARRERL
jgi:hypothetical protein